MEPGDEAPLDDLDALIRRVDEGRWLSSRYVADAERRADLIALYAYDHEITRAPRVVSKPLLGEIRLAWWREALDAIYAGQTVRRHPVAEALKTTVARRGLPREFLETPLDARYDDLQPGAFEDEAALNAWLDAAYGSIMAAAARMLDPAADPHAARSAARLWGLARTPAKRLPTGLQPRRAMSVHRKAAGSELRDLPIAAFPAVAHVSLAAASPVSKRLRLIAAVLRGRV